MPLCWIFLLKRRRALSNVSFSPTRTSANPGSPPQARGLVSSHRARGQPALTLPDGSPVQGWRSIAEALRAVKRSEPRATASDGHDPPLQCGCSVAVTGCEVGYLPGADEPGDGSGDPGSEK